MKSEEVMCFWHRPWQLKHSYSSFLWTSDTSCRSNRKSKAHNPDTWCPADKIQTRLVNKQSIWSVFTLIWKLCFLWKEMNQGFFDVRLQFGCVLAVWTEKSCIFNLLLFTLLNWFWSYCSLRWVFYSSWLLCCNTLFTFTRLTNKSHQNSKRFIELASNCTIFHFLT